MKEASPEILRTILENAGPLLNALGMDDEQITEIFSMLGGSFNDEMMNKDIPELRNYGFGSFIFELLHFAL